MPDVQRVPRLFGDEELAYETLPRVYRGRRRSVADLRLELIENAGGVCPYCGQILSLRSLDHFLPQEYYPDFALLRGNLVPICDACNSAKGAKIVDSTGDRLFLHPYGDAELKGSLTECVVYWDRGVARFHIRASSRLRPVVTHRVERHLRACGIQPSFARAAAGEHRRWKRLQALSKGYTRNTLRKRMREDIASHGAEYGANNWRSVTVRAILEDARAFDAVFMTCDDSADSVDET